MFSVGTNVQRIDGNEKVAGKAVYAGDLRLPGMAIWESVAQPGSRMRAFGSIDASRASGVAGRAGRADARYISRSRPILSAPMCAISRSSPPTKCATCGDMVAAVAATEPSIAAQALTLIDVDYEELPAVFSIDDALQDGRAVGA